MSSAKLLKGTLQTIILKLLEDQDRMYGYEITQRVRELSGGEFNLTEGALYPALHKLEAEGLLETSTELVDGRIRKYYSLSSQGKGEVKTKMNEAATFIEKLQLVLNLKPTVSCTH
ncbi:DNA-binding transcriptional regulator, PadR family [Parapedobacter composti]|uniref:DNA-binding transcriptional regulator, PadR family n=1 Tax=Parapedobacter composti TaxID=623281 RepID=A0A1I1M9F2_9SPHI|nr:PadR family transcriptional regulator [Parapedobacter composti]SFC81994.1 DNA-binding transcriptional regulator, PadR family [Parapedobacter composti]